MFTYQGCFKLIKSDDKDMYHVTNISISINAVLLNFYSSKKPEKNLLSCFQHNNNNNKKFEQQISILELFPKDHVTGVNDAKNSPLKS